MKGPHKLILSITTLLSSQWLQFILGFVGLKFFRLWMSLLYNAMVKFSWVRVNTSHDRNTDKNSRNKKAHVFLKSLKMIWSWTWFQNWKVMINFKFITKFTSRFPNNTPKMITVTAKNFTKAVTKMRIWKNNPQSKHLTCNSMRQ